MFRAGLKAGIIMGIVAIVVVVIQGVIVLQFHPPGSEEPSAVVFMAGALLALLQTLVLWFASGILAGRFGAAAALTTGAAAGAGALAGAIAQIISQIAGVVMGFIFAAYLTEPPGAPPSEPVIPIIFIAMVGVPIAIAAGLGALGGIVGRAISARRGS